MSTQEGIEIRWIVNVIRRWIWLIIGCTLLAATIAYNVMLFMTPVYNATVTMLVEPAQDSNTSGYDNLVAGERLAITYSQMATGQPILQDVISRLGLKESTDELAKKISAESIKNTQLILLTVKDSSPSRAALIANAIAESLTTRIQSLQATRYNSSLSEVQDKITTLSATIDETQSQINSLRATIIEKGGQLTRQESLQDGYRSDYHALQQNYQDLQMTVDQLTDKVHVVEAAQIQPETNPNKFLATVTLLIDQSLMTGGNNYSSPASDQLADTYGQMLKSPALMQTVIAKLGLSESSEELLERVIVNPVRGTQLVRLSLTDTNSSRAQQLADTIAEVFISQTRILLAKPYTDRLANMQMQMDDLLNRIDQAQSEITALTAAKAHAETELTPLESQIAGDRSDLQTLQENYEQLRLNATKASDAVVITEQAQVPQSPVQHRLVYTLLAATVGLIVGIGLAFLLEQLNDRVRNSQDVRTMLGLSTLGMIAQIPKGDDELVVISNPGSYLAESFHVLSTNIRLYGTNIPLRTILVTSSTPTEGKSVVAANLAAALAKTGQRIVVVDADLRLPRQHQLFHMKQGEGLTGSLLKGSIDGNLQSAPVEGLRILTSGEIATSPAEVMSSPQLVRLLEELKANADFVIIDSPPILSAAEATILASETDGVLLVLRSGYIPGHAIREAVDRLHQAKAHMIGVVLNGVESRRDDYYKVYGYEGRKSPSSLRQWLRSQAEKINSFRRNPKLTSIFGWKTGISKRLK